MFDEVDAGIGGHTARAVGARLRELGQTRQVLCITHLPQIASLGDRHFSIVKETADELDAHDRRASWPSARSSPSSCGCSAPMPTTPPRGATRGTCAGPPEQAFLRLRRVRSTPARVTLGWMAATRPSPSVPVSNGALAPVTRPIIPPERRMPARTASGPVRSGRRTKLLVKHLVRGDIALIDHLDIDRVSAEELIAAGVTAGAQLQSLFLRHLSEPRPAAAGRGGHPARRPARR